MLSNCNQEPQQFIPPSVAHDTTRKTGPTRWKRNSGRPFVVAVPLSRSLSPGAHLLSPASRPSRLPRLARSVRRRTRRTKKVKKKGSSDPDSICPLSISPSPSNPLRLSCLDPSQLQSPAMKLKIQPKITSPPFFHFLYYMYKYNI